MSDIMNDTVQNEPAVNTEAEAVKADMPEAATETVQADAPAADEVKAPEADKPEAEAKGPAQRAPQRNRNRLQRDTPRNAPQQQRRGAQNNQGGRRQGGARNSRIEQVEVVISGASDKPAVVELRPYRNTVVRRVGPASRSKFILKYDVTLDTLPAQNLLERNFEHISWSADQLANYIARNRNVADMAAFEEQIDNESSRIDEKLNEGLMTFTGYLKDAGIDINNLGAEGSGWTRPVTFHLTIESNTATRFVKLVKKFDDLCKILDVMHVLDQLGSGATVRHRSEIEKWRRLVNSLARIVITSQHQANEMITTNALPAATPNRNRPALAAAAEVAKNEEGDFGRKVAAPQLEMAAEKPAEPKADEAADALDVEVVEKAPEPLDDEVSLL